MTKKNKLLIVALFLGLLFSFIIMSYKVPCLFKTIFKIPCPSCGLTRAFKAILNLNFVSAFNYNILSIPIFIMIIIFIGLSIYDLIKDKKNLSLVITTLLNKYWYIIIFLVLLSFIVNIIRGV